MNKTKRARYTLEFKLEAVRLVKAGQSVAAVAATRTCRRNRFPTGSKLNRKASEPVHLATTLRSASQISLSAASSDGKWPRAFDLPDFFGPFQAWGTASVASVEQYCCLNSSGVRYARLECGRMPL